MINSLLTYGNEYGIQHGLDIKFHLLGINSLNNIRTDFVYSVDGVTAIRRAVDRKVYVIKNGKLKLIKVDQVKEWNCSCPVCIHFKDFVLENSGTRKAHVRFIHNLWVISQFINQTHSNKL